jgi:hypothetical protein
MFRDTSAPHVLCGFAIIALMLLTAVALPERAPFPPPVLLAVAVPLALLRRGSVVDGERRTVTGWWGLLVPMVRRTELLPERTHVAIVSEWHAFQYAMWKTWQRRDRRVCCAYLRLSVTEEWPIAPFCSLTAANRAAEAVAEVLALPLVDETAQPPVTRTAEELRTPLRERVARGQVALTCPEEPHDAFSWQTVGNESLTYDIPNPFRRRSERNLVIVLLMWPVAIGGLAALGVLGELWLLCLALLVPTLHLLSTPPVPAHGWLVTASPEELSVCARGRLWSHTTCVPADRVKYLQIVVADSLETVQERREVGTNPHAILVSCLDGSVAFGTGLRRRELDWIRATIEVALNAE